MPIYEYKCNVCDHQMDKLQKLNDEPLRICPQCSEPALQKQISASGFRLIGKGWYETDFKTASTNGSESPAVKTGNTDSAKSSVTKADSKTKETNR